MSDHDADGQRCPSKNPFDTVPGPSPVPALGKLLRLCHMLALEGKQLAAVMAEGNGSELSHDYLIPIRHLASEAVPLCVEADIENVTTVKPDSRLALAPSGCSSVSRWTPQTWMVSGRWGGSRNNSCRTLGNPRPCRPAV